MAISTDAVNCWGKGYCGQGISVCTSAICRLLSISCKCDADSVSAIKQHTLSGVYAAMQS